MSLDRESEKRMYDLAVAVSDCLEEFEVDPPTFALIVKMYCDRNKLDVVSFGNYIIKTEQMRKLMLGKYRIDIDDTEDEDEQH